MELLYPPPRQLLARSRRTADLLGKHGPSNIWIPCSCINLLTYLSSSDGSQLGPCHPLRLRPRWICSLVLLVVLPPLHPHAPIRGRRHPSLEKRIDPLTAAVLAPCQRAERVRACVETRGVIFPGRIASSLNSCFDSKGRSSCMHSAGVFVPFFCVAHLLLNATPGALGGWEGLFIWWVRSARPTMERNSFRTALMSGLT